MGRSCSNASVLADKIQFSVKVEIINAFKILFCSVTDDCLNIVAVKGIVSDAFNGCGDSDLLDGARC